MRATIRALLIAGLVAAGARPMLAQDTVRVRTADSLKADSLRRKLADTISTTDRLLKVSKDQHVELRPLSLCGVTSLQPIGTRVVFTRDSIDWAPAQSITELVARVPGVFTEKSDWIGTPELVNYFSRGAASVEYVLDCVPYLPIGADSVGVAPTIPLSMLDRVEVERSPGMMRVFMFTRRHDRMAPRTKIGASQGDRGATRYSGAFERRYTSGFGLSLGADYVGLNPQGNGTGGGYTPSAWLQFSYAPTPRFGLQAQLVAQLPSLNLLLDDVTKDTLLREMNASRSDFQLRGSWRQRDDGLGNSLDVFAAHTSWSTTDSLPGSEGVGQFGAIAARRGATWSAQLSTWHYTRTTSLDSRLDLGFAPTERFSGSLELVAQRHDGDRKSQWATARAGLKLPLGFNIGGVISDGHRVQAPTLADDVAQRFTDAELTAGFGSRIFALDAGYTRNEGWRPQAFQEFAAIASLAPFGQTDWLTMHARLTPLGWLTFETLYQNPLSDAPPDATPPRHFLTTATIRSRFLRNFKSGIFDLKLQGVLESWSDGIGGRDTTGAAIPLPGGTFFRGIFQFQIGPFIAYYDRINLKATHTGYVPGYPIQVGGQTFGIRWEFSN